MKKISVVTGIYNEAEIVRDLYGEVKKVFSGLKDYDYEHIFTDNCSTDGTISILREIASQDKRVKVLTYSNNFGAIKNEVVGYQYASGNAVVFYEGNLKDPPELIPAFIKKWEEGFDVVYGIRSKTHDVLVMFFMRKVFYRIVNVLSGGEFPLDSGSFRLVSRRVVDELIKMDDYKPYLRGMIAAIGFKQTGIEYTRRVRPKGRSKSHLGYLVDFAINAMISCPMVPVRLCTYTGLAVIFLSFITMIVLFVLKFIMAVPQISVMGFILAAVFLFFGFLYFFLGVIGEYVCAIHSQVRKRQFIIIQEKINFD